VNSGEWVIAPADHPSEEGHLCPASNQTRERALCTPCLLLLGEEGIHFRGRVSERWAFFNHESFDCTSAFDYYLNQSFFLPENRNIRPMLINKIPMRIS